NARTVQEIADGIFLKGFSQRESVMAIDLDVLIIGGGVQGLWLLNDLTQLGYTVFLITNRPLGVGQTMHSHVYIHHGYLYEEIDLARRLKRTRVAWEKFI